MELNWVKCGTDNHWCNFEQVTIDPNNIGVYMIFYLGSPGRVVRLGQGIIRDRISVHRTDQKITHYSSKGLLVTWAEVDRQYLDGVEKYLADTWNPLVGDAFPDVRPIAVNSPFG